MIEEENKTYSGYATKMSDHRRSVEQEEENEEGDHIHKQLNNQRQIVESLRLQSKSPCAYKTYRALAVK